jgi:hypothetical protein
MRNCNILRYINQRTNPSPSNDSLEICQPDLDRLQIYQITSFPKCEILPQQQPSLNNWTQLQQYELRGLPSDHMPYSYTARERDSTHQREMDKIHSTRSTNVGYYGRNPMGYRNTISQPEVSTGSEMVNSGGKIVQ